MRIYEAECTDTVTGELIRLSGEWEAEGSCRGYRANTPEDLTNRRIFLAEENDRIFGYLFGIRKEAERSSTVMEKGTPFFEVEELYVVPEWRNRGIGRKLFEFAETQVQDEAEVILLSTATKNWRAVLHFYLEELDLEFWSATLFKHLTGASLHEK